MARKLVPAVLTVLGYVIATFGVQGASHFAINVEHYAAIPIMRTEPVLPMGIAAMLIQGSIFAALFPLFRPGERGVWDGVKFSWAIGGFLASYILLGEAGKYAIPSIPAWLAVEGSAAFVQFSAFGVVLGLIHRQRPGGAEAGM